MKEQTKNFIFTMLICVVAFLTGYVANAINNSFNVKIPETYYLEAEVLSQNKEETIFCTEKGNFSINRTDINPDTLYLLTMFTNGTKDEKDDEVAVIWQVVD